MDRPVCIISRPFWREINVQSGLEVRTTIGLLLALALLTMIGWLYLDQTAIITATRAEIRALQREQEDLHIRARYLQAKIAEQSSVDRVMRLAENAGLRPQAQCPTLRVGPPSAYLAVRTAGLSEVDEWSAGMPEADAVWWLNAVSRLESWITSTLAVQG